MRRQHVGDVIVVEELSDGSARPVGILTDRDIVLGLLERDERDLERLEVGQLMTDEIVTVTDDELVVEALKKMRAHGVRRLPVVDAHDQLVGILTMDDVLDHVTEMLEDMVMLVGRGEQREAMRR